MCLLTSAGLIVWVVGNHVSSVQVSGQDEGDVHDPVDHCLGLWSQLESQKSYQGSNTKALNIQVWLEQTALLLYLLEMVWYICVYQYYYILGVHVRNPPGSESIKSAYEE